MRDWIVILLIALASAGFGLWMLRQRKVERSDHTGTGSARGGSSEEAPKVPASARQSARPVEKAVERGPVPSVAVPNTKVLPHPEDRPVATLEFDGPPGRVDVKRGEVVIGRHSSDDIRIPDVRVSRHHAKLVARRDGGFEIHNLTAVRSEPNPMLVNGASREHSDIADGDVITLGGVSFHFRLAGP